MNLELYPVYNPNALVHIWPTIQYGVKQVCINTLEDVDLAQVYNDITSGRSLLWVGYFKGQYCGFVTTRVRWFSPLLEKRLWIMQLYIKGGLDPMIIFNGCDVLEQYAKKEACKAIEFFTLRDKAFQRKLPEEWKQGYAQFIKEVK